MSFVNDDSKLSACHILKILVSEQELLNSADDNTLLIVDSFRQSSGALLVIDSFYQTGNVLEAVDGILQLRVENNTVGDNDNGIKDRVILGIMNRSQSVGNPSNRIRLTGACRVFNQVVKAGTFLFNIGKYLFYYVILMISRKNKLFLLYRLCCPILSHYFFLFRYKGNEAVNQVKKRITLQHFFPKVGGGVTFLILRISFTTGLAGTVGTLIERHKICRAILELRSHPDFKQIYSEVDEETVVQSEAELL